MQNMLEPFSMEKTIPQTIKNNDRAHGFVCERGAKVDAQTHNKSMPAKHIMKMSKNHVYLNGNILQKYCKHIL